MRGNPPPWEVVSRTLGSTPRPPTPTAGAEAVEARGPTGVPARGTTAPQPRMATTAGPGAAAAAAAEAVTTDQPEVEAEAGGWWGEEGITTSTEEGAAGAQGPASSPRPRRLIQRELQGGLDPHLPVSRTGRTT